MIRFDSEVCKSLLVVIKGKYMGQFLGLAAKNGGVCGTIKIPPCMFKDHAMLLGSNVKWCHAILFLIALNIKLYPI